MTPQDFKNKNAGRFDEAALERALDKFAVPPFDQGAAMARVMRRLDDKKRPEGAASFPRAYRWPGGMGMAAAAAAILFWLSPAPGPDEIDRFLSSAQLAAEEIALQEEMMALWDDPADAEIEHFLDEILTEEEWG